MAQSNDTPRQRVPRICEICSADFTTRMVDIERGAGKYCSRPCRNESYRRNPKYTEKHPVMSEYCVSGNVALIPLINKKREIQGWTLVDAIDAPWITQNQWYLSNQGYVVRGERREIDGNIKLVNVRLHREILSLYEGNPLTGDHKNRNTADNRRSNLRVITGAQQSQNLPALTGKSSKYRGVCWVKRYQKWQVNVEHQGKVHYFGRYTDEDEAGEVARQARLAIMPFALD